MNELLRRIWWLPLLLLVVLVLKAWLVGTMLVSEARGLAAEAAGVGEEQVEMYDGLNVRLVGFDDQAALDTAIADVDAIDASWDVTGELATPPAAPSADTDADADADAATPTTEAPATPALAPAAVIMAASPDGGVVLSGTVVADDVRSALVEAAEAALPDAVVTDELVVDGDAVAADGGTLTLTGAALTADQQARWRSAATGVGDVIGLDVADETTVEEVDVQLNDLFALDPVEFEPGSDTLTAESEATLDAAAALLNAIPEARLQVEGHTDTDGDAAINQSLSLRRAESVVAYLTADGGVDAERLEAVGRGETDLKVDPERTPEDKQRNRRIEWVRVS